jgi:hypothetical protein
VGVFLAEKFVHAELNEVYGRLKASQIRNKCKIISEEIPKTVSTIQGSLWGTSPKYAQKKTEYQLRQDVDGTRIVATSNLTSGYINLTLSGVALSIGLMLLCVWIALDLQTYALNGVQGVWGWLAEIHGRVNLDLATLFIRLGWILAAFLVATLVAESIVVARVRSGVNVFAREILKSL